MKAHPEGIGEVLSNLIPEQINLGNKVFLASTNPNAICSDIHVLDFSNMMDVKEFLHTEHMDIVLFHGIYNKKYLKIYKELLNKRIPYIITLHGALSQENYRKNLFRKWFANVLYFGSFMKHAKSIIYLNKGEYNNSIVPRYNQNATYIPNGCFPNPISLNISSFKSVIQIIFLGRMDVDNKGLDILFDALDLCKIEQLNIKVNFYGKQYDKTGKYVTDRIKELDSIASYNGIVKGEEKDFVLKNADIFILTSRSEGMPMGVLEALSNGIPCILTPRTNMAYEVEDAHAGWKCELNAKSIAETIKKAISEYKTDPSYYKTNAIALSKKYTWDKIAEKSIEEYKKIINS